MSLFALSQILVGGAIITDIISFQFKERVHIVSCLMVSCVLIATHFICLGHYTAAYLGSIAATRFLVSIFSTSRIFLLFYLSIAVLTTALTYAGLLSLLACAAAIFGTMASFCKEDKLLRQFLFVSTSLWITHNSIAGSPGAVLLEVLFISSNLVGYFRYYIRPCKQAA